jgi:hypothetical protein
VSPHCQCVQRSRRPLLTSKRQTPICAAAELIFADLQVFTRCVTTCRWNGSIAQPPSQDSMQAARATVRDSVHGFRRSHGGWASNTPQCALLSCSVLMHAPLDAHGDVTYQLARHNVITACRRQVRDSFRHCVGLPGQQRSNHSQSRSCSHSHSQQHAPAQLPARPRRQTAALQRQQIQGHSAVQLCRKWCRPAAWVVARRSRCRVPPWRPATTGQPGTDGWTGNSEAPSSIQ